MYSVKELQNIVNTEFDRRLAEMKNSEPANLYAPVTYSLEMAGKRLRPVMLLLAYNIFSGDVEKALPAAVAIEVFHNFTLLHDDIMDNAAVRRNRPTVHKKFDENSAILSGDAMAFLSYKYLLEIKSDKIQEVTELFTQTAIEVCEGQQYDMDFENRPDVSEPEYLEMIRLKTAVLLACSLKAGALLAGAGSETARLLYRFGINTGLAFQLQDDLLDTFGDEKTFGKKIGGDIVSNKKTYLFIKALENSSEREREELLYLIDKKDFIAAEKIEAVKNIYNKLKIKELTQSKIDYYFNIAGNILEKTSIKKEMLQPLADLSNQILNRNY